MSEIHFEMIKAMESHQVQGVSVAIIDSGIIKTINSSGSMKSNSDLYVNEKSIFNACSISKVATAVLVMKLVSDNVLHLDLDINEQLKSWKVSNNEYTKHQKVTLKNLLCHQAGFVDLKGSFGEYSKSSGTPSIVDILNGITTYNSKPATIEYEPNSDFMYSDLGYCLIELLIMDVTGKSFKELMQQEIFEPLQMEDSWIIDKPLDEGNEFFTLGHDKHGNHVEMSKSIYPYPAAAGLWCTSKDLATLFIEISNSLNGHGKLQIKPLVMQEMVKAQGCKSWSGLGVFLDSVESNLEVSSFGWGKGYQCMLVGYPKSGAGTVIMTNTDTGIHQLKGFIGEVFNAVKS